VIVFIDSSLFAGWEWGLTLDMELVCHLGDVVAEVVEEEWLLFPSDDCSALYLASEELLW